MIGLWIAARDWRPGAGRNFRSFAELVIKRRLATCLKLAKRDKHAPLNDSIRLLCDEDGVLDQAVDQLPHLHQVADVAEDRERLAAVLRAIDTELSPLERQCILGIAAGLTYAQIGPPRRVDNALANARRKLRAAV